MIRTNSATELCITKGQEGTMYAWTESVGTHGYAMLEVVFVQLIDPPSNMQVGDLPPNVVPVVCTSKTVVCNLPDDTTVKVSRTQVEITTNFAMTDFASQGKTRPYNAVDLNNCRSHQSYYTALSHAATADGTTILPAIGNTCMSPIDPKKIQGGCSGRLRQEFRELKMLDDITRKMYEGLLPVTVFGDTQYSVVQSYLSHVGIQYSPPNMDSALMWSTVQPFDMRDATDLVWHKALIPHKPIARALVLLAQLSTAPGHSVPHPDGTVRTAAMRKVTPMKPPKKRKGRTSDTFNKKQNSSGKRVHEQDQHAEQSPLPVGCSASFAELGSNWLDMATMCFERFSQHEYTLEEYPSEFVFGHNTSGEALTMRLLRSASVFATTEHKCSSGHSDTLFTQHCCVVVPHHTSPLPWDMHQQFFDNTLSIPASDVRCKTCGSDLCTITTYNMAPPLFAIGVASMLVPPDHAIHLATSGGPAHYHIAGIVYYGASHFTARYFDADGTVWYNDGMVQARRASREGSMNDIDLCHDPNGKVIVTYIYVRNSHILL
ncbi:hypothetical protein EDD18DRAFT_1458732 [Armillaria luteobubalina]|uniref:Uncharacterized protein n=1 Tax=Armillaria luteobubalina TaxID=153913 RepID=A0AA39QHS1_9AGAR|nr:hypothetical protein EDD18DRAFT_1458732 [Armillaria luteobubalina]